MVDDTDAFLAWLDSLPKEPNDKLKAMYAAYKATVKTAPDLTAELVEAAIEWRTARKALSDFERDNPGNSTKAWTRLLSCSEYAEEAFFTTLAKIKESKT